MTMVNDISNPAVTCTVCGRTRDPQLHMTRRGHPVRKAENWLKRTCRSPMLGKPCDFTYRAGIRIGGPAQGQ